jgi:UDP-N-acetylmuramate--alanine ligase
VVVDDYGHHPTEIRCTINAAKTAWPGRLIVVFQPHRFSRTKDLAQEFAEAFDQADVLYVTDIYSAGEPPIPGVTAESLAQRIQANGHPSVNWIGEKEDLVKEVLPTLASGDVVLTLGAGDIWKVGSKLLECL